MHTSHGRPRGHVIYVPIDEESESTPRPWVAFLLAAAVGAAAYAAVRALRARRRGDIEVEVDLGAAADTDLDSPGPDILDEAWLPSDGEEALPGRA
jgi:hypothetical protein